MILLKVLLDFKQYIVSLKYPYPCTSGLPPPLAQLEQDGQLNLFIMCEIYTIIHQLTSYAKARPLMNIKLSIFAPNMNSGRRVSDAKTVCFFPKDPYVLNL